MSHVQYRLYRDTGVQYRDAGCTILGIQYKIQYRLCRDHCIDRPRMTAGLRICATLLGRRPLCEGLPPSFHPAVSHSLPGTQGRGTARSEEGDRGVEDRPHGLCDEPLLGRRPLREGLEGVVGNTEDVDRELWWKAGGEGKGNVGASGGPIRGKVCRAHSAGGFMIWGVGFRVQRP
jgi:hypothetical protein